MPQLLPHITPEMLKKFPDQATDTLNRLIDTVNALNNK